MVAGGDFHDTHRSEALKMVHGTLDRPEAAKDPQFGKALLGGASSLARLAAMLEDVDLAPLVLGLLCAAKPPGAKLGQISGNLAALISNKGVPHSEQTRARAAELLLHIQGGEGEVSRSDGREVTSSAQVPKSSINDLLERCEGIAAHEESMEAALRSQLEEGIAKGLQALEPHAENVAQAKDVARQRLQDLPSVDFKSFESSFQMLRSAREALASHVKKCESLHENIDRQLKDLQRARPNVDPHVFKEKLLAAEQLYSEVKSQREASSTAEADAKEKTGKAQASTARMKTLNDELRRYDQELHELRAERKDKETKAALLRSKANTPGLEDRKKQVQEDIDRNLEEAREMQVIGRRVQQGEDGYLSEGQSRDSKIAELTTKLNELKRHHQQLLQKQKELDIDPVALGDQASRLENEASELDLRIGNLEDRQREAERNRIEASGDATRESEDARSARDHASHLASRLSSVERDAKAQLSALQPMIQEQHAGWQRLLAKQRNLDEDQYNLGLKLLETKHAAESEARSRQQVAGIVQDVVKSLLSFAQTLESCGEAPQAPTGAQAVAQAPLADEFDDFLQQDSVRDPFGGAEPDPFGGDDEEDPFAVTAVPRSNPSPTHREEEVFAGESFEGV
ncbi:unnamed protein product [Effrenium voratum]|nr:unnamed protein product [Effrenium voratum]